MNVKHRYAAAATNDCVFKYYTLPVYFVLSFVFQPKKRIVLFLKRSRKAIIEAKN